jgi:hypothetical protein
MKLSFLHYLLSFILVALAQTNERQNLFRRSGASDVPSTKKATENLPDIDTSIIGNTAVSAQLQVELIIFRT